MRPRSNLLRLMLRVESYNQDTYRTTKSMVKLRESNNGMDKATMGWTNTPPKYSKSLMRTHLQVARACTYYINSHINTSNIIVTTRYCWSIFWISLTTLTTSCTHNFLLGEALIHKKFIKAVSFHYW